MTERIRPLELLPILAGVGTLLAGTLLGWDARVLDLVVAPPVVVRVALAATAVVLAFVLLGGAVARLEGHDGVRGNLPSMVRGIRLAFLALAALAAAAGWLLAHPLPFVVALIIAGIDVVETSFLLLVVRRSGASRAGPT